MKPIRVYADTSVFGGIAENFLKKSGVIVFFL